MTEPVLPKPIKPRVLKKTHGEDGYRTTDGRYMVLPQRYGVDRRVRFWKAIDLTVPREDPRRSRDFVDLDAVRRTLCAPGNRVPWLVCDMDQGVMHVAESRRAAVAWAASHADAPVRQREHAKGSTCYDYTFGFPGEDSNTCLFVMRADHAARHRFDPVQEPWFPYADHPHTEGPRALQEAAERDHV
ncbi:hypothetical protein [Streptomyces sp. cg35]|uniref:hypothetical protein n=1 Tax=Streptomyces sp. cg35 TaxID=3421650 RepID=UPI003D1776BE